jgi:hypothetical protein
VVDGTGKYLLPGFWDLHVHSHFGNAGRAPVFVANGITGIRELDTPMPTIDSIRAKRRKPARSSRRGSSRPEDDRGGRARALCSPRLRRHRRIREGRPGLSPLGRRGGGPRCVGAWRRSSHDLTEAPQRAQSADHLLRGAGYGRRRRGLRVLGASFPAGREDSPCARWPRRVRRPS